jgi:hypothetical protein
MDSGEDKIPFLHLFRYPFTSGFTKIDNIVVFYDVDYGENDFE